MAHATAPPDGGDRAARHVRAHATSADAGGRYAPSMRDDAWARTVELFEAGAYWEAHEALEPLWLEARGLERSFSSGVILLAAALHKARAMGTPRGGRRNFAKALAHLAVVPDDYRGVDVRELEARVHRALQDPDDRPRWPGAVPAAEAGPEGATAGDAAVVRDALPHHQRRARRPAGDQRLERARRGRLLAGIAAGTARFVGGDVRVVRALWIASVPLSLGITAIGYVLLWVLLPAGGAAASAARAVRAPT